MDDESFELEDGEVVASPVTGPSSADVPLRAQLREAAAVLRRRGQPELARLALGVVEADLNDALWVLDDLVRGGGSGGGGDFSAGGYTLLDAFRHTISRELRRLQEAGYDEDELYETFLPMVLVVTQHAARLAQTNTYYGIVVVDDDETSQQPYRDGGGYGAVPASAAAVRTLEKQTFRAAAGGNADDGGGGITECGICFEEFVDGVQVAVMPCPCRVHKFHLDCISKWLAISNMCPLCRYQLPA